MNTEYLIWFAALVVVAGAALLWLAIGDVPEIPTDPEATSEVAGEDGFAELA
jgi:hypothetical protein